MSTILQLCLTEYIKDKTLAQMELERILNDYNMSIELKYTVVQDLISKIALLNNKILVTSQYMEDTDINNSGSRHREDE